MRENARFVDQRCCGYLATHKAGLYSRLAREKCRKSFTFVGICEPIDPPLADIHQIRERNSGVIKSHRERRAVKISAGNHIAGLGKNKRVVSRRAGFDFEDLFAMPEDVAHRAMNLWHAANAVGVLDG